MLVFFSFVVINHTSSRLYVIRVLVVPVKELIAVVVSTHPVDESDLDGHEVGMLYEGEQRTLIARRT
jgi:hypothetical protein